MSKHEGDNSMEPACAIGVLIWGVCTAAFVMAAKAPTNIWWSLLMAFGAIVSACVTAVFLLFMFGKVDFFMEKIVPFITGHTPRKVDVD